MHFSLKSAYCDLNSSEAYNTQCLREFRFLVLTRGGQYL